MQLNYGVRGIEKRKMMGFVMDDRKVERKVVVLSQNSHFLMSPCGLDLPSPCG